MQVKILQIQESTGVKTSSSLAVYQAMREEAKADREIFWVLHLNNQNEIIEKEIAAIGTLFSAPIHPREIFRKAVVNSTSSIICVHNHPTGNVFPSLDDKRIAHRLFFVGEILEIPVLDFIIIGQIGHYSFSDAGLIEGYKDNAKSKLSFDEVT